jgi:phenylalanyl-tRNA synthetase beta subunit (EC 6.1.1.20)
MPIVDINMDELRSLTGHDEKSDQSLNLTSSSLGLNSRVKLTQVFFNLNSVLTALIVSLLRVLHDRCDITTVMTVASRFRQQTTLSSNLLLLILFPPDDPMSPALSLVG